MKKHPNSQQTKEEIKTAYAENIISTLREPFLVLDEKLCVISANQSFYTNFKVSKKETIGEVLFDLGNGQWKIPELIALLQKALIKKKKVKDYEVEHRFEHIGHRIMRLNATKMNISKDLSKIITKNKQLILLAIEDITELRKKEKEIREKEEKISKFKNEFLLQTIHDLRVPTTAIRWILERYNDPTFLKRYPELREDAALMQQANTRMLKLIRYLFEIAEDRRPGLVLKKERIDLASLIRNVIRETEETAVKKNIKIDYVTKDVAPLVLGDSDRLIEVFTNLIDNAIKYNEEGGSIVITHQFDKKYVKSTVSDTGKGISPKDLTKIFKPFFRGETNKKIEGVGLGLYIIKNLVEKMGGEVTVTSSLGSGSTFVISLPRAN